MKSVSSSCLLLRPGSFCSVFFFFSSRRRHTRSYGDSSSDVCSSDLDEFQVNTVPGRTPFGPSVGTDANRNFVVAWYSIQQDGDWNIFARIFESNGTPRTGEFQEIGRASCRERV